MAGLDLTLVLACYNEEAVFERSVESILETLDYTRWSYEVIFVDDVSQDRTRDLILERVESDSSHRLKYIFHERNTGRGGAVADGLRAASGTVAGFVDIDLEVAALYIPACVQAVRNGADIATGRRWYRLQLRQAGRWILTRGYRWLSRWLLGVSLEDTETGFKFFNREKILLVLADTEDTHWFWDTEVMVRSVLRGYKIVEIPCLFDRRFDKESTVRPVRDALDYFLKLLRFRRTVRELQSRRDAAL